LENMIIMAARVKDNASFVSLLLEIFVVATRFCGIFLIEVEFARIGTAFFKEVGTNVEFGINVVVRVAVRDPRITICFVFSSTKCGALTSLHGKYTILT